ncbi:MAG: hypothetical protein PHF86_04970 [Candidatus Nanoarchaeia archaeon]|jgi:hypothetical protein|nr:hypothetical protein [Candidatus Nanoarchaeia archaeon]
MANKITPKKDGDQLGCTDMDAPEEYTPEQLSRVHDLLLVAQRLEDSANVPMLTTQTFRLLPETLKLEFNYSNWKYRQLKQ